MKRRMAILMAGFVLTAASLTLHAIYNPWSGSAMAGSFLAIR